MDFKNQPAKLFVPKISGTTSRFFYWRLFAIGGFGAALIVSLGLLAHATIAISFAQESSLMAWWPFAGSASDAVGSAPGTVSGATVTTGHDGTANGAYLLNGTSDYISFGTNKFSLDQTNTLTVSLWVKPVSDSATAYYDPIMVRSGYVRPFAIQYVSGGIRIGIRVPSDVIYLTSHTSLADNTWNHVAVTYNGSQVVLYINGAVDGSVSASGSLDVSNNETTQIGKSPEANQYFSGAVDDARIYSQALNASEIQALYNGSDPTPSPTSCTENWTCGDWLSCSSGTQTRTCTDANSCGTTTTRPATTQSCGGVCTESWTCAAWSACSAAGTQTRTCTDTTACGTTAGKPAETQSCTYIPPTGGTTYYVDFDGGSDSAPGTSAGSAWKHAPGDPNATGNANRNLQPGNKVLFKGGVHYRGSIDIPSSGTAGNYITYDGDSWPGLAGTKAIIDGSEPITNTNWHKCSSAADCGGNSNWNNIYYSYITQPTHLTVAPALFLNLIQDDQPVKAAQNPPSDEPYYQVTTNYYSVPASSVSATSLTDPRLDAMGGSSLVGAYVYLWVNPNGVVSSKISGYNSSSKTITFETANVYTDRATLYSIANSLHNAVLDSPGEYYYNETAEANGSHKIYLWPLGNRDLTAGGEVSYSTRTSGIRFGGNNFVVIEGFKIQKQGGDSFGEGIAIGKGSYLTTDLVVRNNEIALRTGDIDGIYLTNANNVLAENNYIHDTGVGRGMTFSGANVTVRNNLLERVGGTGIFFAGVHGGQIINNSLIDNHGVHGNGISTYLGSENILVANNRVINSNIAYTFEYSKDFTIINNIFDGSNHTTYVVAAWGGMTGSVNFFNNTVLGSTNDCSILFTAGAQYNLKNNIMDGGGSATSLDRSNNIYTSLCWNQDASKYGWSLGSNEIFEPNLGSLFGSDYRLKDGSPAVNRGANLAGSVNTDIEGTLRPQGSAWDIGAYEYYSGHPVTPPPHPV